MKQVIISAMLLFSTFGICNAQNSNEKIFTKQDTILYHQIMEKLATFQNAGKNQVMVLVAKELLGTPYVAGTLETIPETLSVYLHQTDCILFVESCLAMTTLLCSDEMKNGIPPFSRYCEVIQSMRYRNGVVDGYTSRIHYTSEWILQNEKNGLLEEYTSKYGERKYQTFSFMSTHPQSYEQLKNSPAEVKKIKETEKNLDLQTKVYTIAAADIPKNEKHIQDGDIICFVSKVKGLDITHVGIAHRENGRLTFIHASLKYKKVVIEPKSLSEYCTTSIRTVRLK